MCHSRRHHHHHRERQSRTWPANPWWAVPLGVWGTLSIVH